MKKIFITLAAILSFAFISCSEDEIATYHGKDFLYYSAYRNQDGYMYDTLKTYNFFFYNAQEYKMPLAVSAGGNIPADHDRTFLVEPEIIMMDTTSVVPVEGIDYVLPREWVMPAGESQTNIYITLKRRDELEGKTFDIRVWLKENENFSLDMPWAIDRYRDTIQRHYIRVRCLAELDRPPFWNVSTTSRMCGYWSIRKFNEMNEVWGTEVADWLSSTSRLRTNFNNYAIIFANYLNRKILEGPDAAIKDPSAESTRGYMTMPGFPSIGIPAVTIPASFPTTDEWEGNQP